MIWHRIRPFPVPTPPPARPRGFTRRPVLEVLEDRLAAGTILLENFDGVAAGLLPTGWSSSVALGTTTAWTTTTGLSVSAPNAVFAPDVAAITDNLLDAPTVTINGGAPRLTFQNNFDLEEGLDGAQLLIAVNNGAFTEFLAAGGSFVTGGYTGTIAANSGSPIAGQQAWTGTSNGFVTTTADLSALATIGDTVAFRWRLATDGTAPGAGQVLDNVQVTANAPSDVSVAIQKAGPAGVTAGQAAAYTVTVTNPGPETVTGAVVAAVPPAALTGVTFTSSVTGGATGNTASGTTAVNDTVTLPPGSTITYTVNGTVDPAATGTLAVTATVTPPAAFPDPNPANNTATATDTITAQADLAVTATNGGTTLIPGAQTTYTVVVSNTGPSTATGAVVAAAPPAALTGVTFTSSVTGGATGNTASGTTAVNDTVTLPPGSTITYLVTGTVDPAATGTLAVTATVTAPGGVTDPTLANNTATDTDNLTPQTDLSVTVDNGVTALDPGGPVTYTVVVANTGSSGATGVLVRAAVPAGLTGVTFTSMADGGASGNTAGSGAITDTVDLPAGATITYTVTGTVDPRALGSLTYRATVTGPTTADTDPTNNAAADTDPINLPVLPANNVQVVQVGGLLLLTGDDLANYVVLDQLVNGQIRVRPGAEGGLLNGQAGELTFGGVTALNVNLNGGDDRVTFDLTANAFQVGGGIAINGGFGANDVVVQAAAGRRLTTGGSLVTTSLGGGFVALNQVTVGGALFVTAAPPTLGGDSTVSLNNVQVLSGGTQIVTGAGNDVVTVADALLTGTLVLVTNGGDDTVTFQGTPGTTLINGVVYANLGAGANALNLAPPGGGTVLLNGQPWAFGAGFVAPALFNGGPAGSTLSTTPGQVVSGLPPLYVNVT